MMVEPKMEDLMELVDTKYTLVVLAAKRARQVNDYMTSLHRPEVLKGIPPLIETESNKPLTVALEEIEAGKVRYSREEKSKK